jgi:hypothetical protein
VRIESERLERKRIDRRCASGHASLVP